MDPDAFLPVVHDRLEMAAAARAVLDRRDPPGVAVELPAALEAAAVAAVRRLPRISVLLSEEPGKEALAWIVAPGDPFAEAIRWALARGRPVFFVDPDLPAGASRREAVPDPYACWELGADAYLDALAGALEAAPPSAADRRREAGMAFQLRAAAQRLGGRAPLALLGAAHVGRVRALLAGPLAQPLARVRRPRVELRHLHPESLTGLLADAPLAHAVWESLRDGSAPAAAGVRPAVNRRVSVERLGLRLIGGRPAEEEAERRRRLLAFAAFACARRGLAPAFAPDRRALAGAVWRLAARSYREQTGEAVAPWQRRLFFDFARRCARVQGGLAPGLWEWVVAARGCADDNLAWEVFDTARCYPWQEEVAEIPTARLDGSELDLGSRKVRFRRRFFRVKQRFVPVPVRPHPAPAGPAEWLRAFDDTGLCSYPPEDLVVEDYGRFLQRRAVSLLAAERARSEPFTTSLLDGVDIKETLRHLHEGGVWVRELGRAPGEAGSVVVVFDRDPDGSRFPFRMTWLGEHDQESDMAFYATPPGEQVVGPGILRAAYGGFLLTSPRGRLADVWTDPDYRFCRDKAEVLLAAGIDYSGEKLIVHAGAEAPSRRLAGYAAAQGKRIVHIPLASLSPASLKKLRGVHILAGRRARGRARDYIW